MNQMAADVTKWRGIPVEPVVDSKKIKDQWDGDFDVHLADALPLSFSSVVHFQSSKSRVFFNIKMRRYKKKQRNELPRRRSNEVLCKAIAVICVNQHATCCSTSLQMRAQPRPASLQATKLKLQLVLSRSEMFQHEISEAKLSWNWVQCCVKNLGHFCSDRALLHRSETVGAMEPSVTTAM